MPIILIGLLVVIATASFAFLVLVARLPVEEADLWLRPITAIFLLFTFVVGGAMLITGYVVVDKLDIRVANAQTEASNAKARAEQEAIKRAELEKSVARRLIPLESEGSSTNVDPLRSFRGMGIIIEVAPDGEAQRAASNISQLLQEAGWKLEKVEHPPTLTGFSDGVDGVVVTSYRPLSLHPTQEEPRSQKAASALVDFLNSYKWVARAAIAGTTAEISPNTVRVSVGVKPEPYFWKETRDVFRRQQMKPEW